ncbi:hypothetical protein WDV93_16790 [Pantoea ananatis]
MAELIRHLLRQWFWVYRHGAVPKSGLLCRARRGRCCGIHQRANPPLAVLLSVCCALPDRGDLAGGLILWLNLLVSAGNLDQLHHGIRQVTMMLAASASYALYGVMTKRWSIPLPVWQSLYVQIAFGGSVAVTRL